MIANVRLEAWMHACNRGDWIDVNKEEDAQLRKKTYELKYGHYSQFKNERKPVCYHSLGKERVLKIKKKEDYPLNLL